MKKRHLRAIKCPHRESDMRDNEPTDEQRKRHNIEMSIQDKIHSDRPH